MECWYINNWKGKNMESGIELFKIHIGRINIIELWIDTWAIDLTVLNFTIGFRIN